jgi:hypothetical protein
MDTLKPQKDPANLLDDLESIRQLLGDDSRPSPEHGENQIPLLFEVVGARPAHHTQMDFADDDADIPTLMPEPVAVPAATAQVVSKEDALLHLDAELRAAAQLIMQDVIDDFAPHIETEIKRRIEARMERLLSQYQN